MMRNAAILALAAIVVGGATASAGAQDLELRIGPNGVEQRSYDRDYGDRDYGDRHYGGDRYRHRHHDVCSPDDAEYAARDFGMHHPRVAYMNDRIVVVEGMTRHGPDRMRFANERGCPRVGR